MPRYKLIIEYDGTAYSGWQRQINGPSVQQTLEEALARLTGEKIGVVGSSRTDAGVHAYGLCAHFDSATRVPPEKICFALNTIFTRQIMRFDRVLCVLFWMTLLQGSASLLLSLPGGRVR